MKRKPIPLYMVDTLNDYKATGRVVMVFPFAGKMSLNGFPRISYGHAYDRMKETLNSERCKTCYDPDTHGTCQRHLPSSY